MATPPPAPKGPIWTDEKLAALSDGDLFALLQNAKRLNREDIVPLIEAEGAKRPFFGKTRARAKKPGADGEQSFQEIEAEKVAKFAMALMTEFDLSPETAKALSVGSPKFQAHAALSSTGAAKIGGLQRQGQIAFERYTSYRVKDEAVLLSAFLKKGESNDNIRYQVQGPQRLLPEGKPTAQVRADLLGGSKTMPKEYLVEFDDFDAAAKKYHSLIASLAPKR